MKKAALYSEAYKILQTVTPLSKDCGKLCNKACCEGIEKESGMYLYPGEEELQARNSFLKTSPLHMGDYSCFLAVCNGKCMRSRRPLACRIFPLVPYLTLKNTLIIQMDPRASSLCPLARTLSRSELDRQFVIKIRQTFQLLITDPEIKDFIIWQSHIVDEYQSIKNQFLSI
ncbi:MAG TPA: hypothetical protein DDW50_03710 [Firmicutes bacterium]|jgi:hypothetical protein|nr:hypothetical protein [Bacillota bacterium]